MSINRAIILGRVGRAPDIRRSQSGDEIATLSVATSETWKDKATGERKERTEWHNVVVFNPQNAGFIRDYVKKGSLVSVEGAMKTRKYTDKDGIERRVTEVVVDRFDGRVRIAAQPGAGQTRDEHGYGSTRTKEDPRTMQHTPQSTAERIDDDIPF